MSPYSNSNYLSSTVSTVSNYCLTIVSIPIIVKTTVELLKCGNETTE